MDVRDRTERVSNSPGRLAACKINKKEDRRVRISFRKTLTAAAVAGADQRRPRRAQSCISTTGPTTSARPPWTDFHSGHRHQAVWCTMCSTPTRPWKASCSPVIPAMTWWCLPTISSASRSSAGAFQKLDKSLLPNLAESSTRQLLKQLGAERPGQSSIPSPTCGAPTASATTSRRSRALGVDSIDSWAVLFEAGEPARSSSSCGVALHGLCRTRCSPPCCNYLGLDPRSTNPDDYKLAEEKLAGGAPPRDLLPFSSKYVSRPGQRRDLRGLRLLRRRVPGRRHVPRRPAKAYADRLQHSEGRGQPLVRHAGHSGRCGTRARRLMPSSITCWSRR